MTKPVATVAITLIILFGSQSLHAANSERWLSLLPADPNVRVLTDVIWSTAASDIPTLRAQHRWIHFPAMITVSSLRIQPLPHTTNNDQDRGNRPLRVIVQTSLDAGTTFKTLADVNLANWIDDTPALIALAPVRVDNLRVVIPKADKMIFPNYANAKKIEVFTEGALSCKNAPAVSSQEPTDFKSFSTGNFALPSDRVTVSETSDTVAFRTPCMRIEFAKKSPRMTFLGWDVFNNTANYDKNLLCTYGPAGAFACVSGTVPSRPARQTDYYYAADVAQDPLATDNYLSAGCGGTAQVVSHAITYRDIKLGDNVTCDLTYDIVENGFDVSVDWNCHKRHNVLQAAALRIPFDMQAVITNVIAMPDTTGPLGLARFPLVINSPDNGQMRIIATQGSGTYAAIHASRPRSEVWLDFIVGAKPLSSGIFELLPGKYHARFQCRLTCVFPYCYCTHAYGDFRIRPIFSAPEADPIRSGLLRSWLSGLAFRPDIGVFANNAVSDPVLIQQRHYAEYAMFTPSLAPGLEPADLMRFTIDQILHGAAFWGMDANAWPSNAGSVMNSVWCYLAKSSDWNWARHNAARIVHWANLLAKNHARPDGLMREQTSGTGTAQSGRSWWDSISSGGIEAYNNALAYRELLRAADIMDRLDKKDLAIQLRDSAARLKANYHQALYDPNTKWIADFRDTNGVLHDFGNIASTGAAITCGVIEPNEGKAMLSSILDKLQQIGYTRFDLGIPQHMLPVTRYFSTFGFGGPLEPDGLETRQVYMNGGAAPGQEYYFLQALYICGMRTKANEILVKLCEGYYSSKTSGPLNSGLDWKRWDGRPAGYEGLLVDMYHPLQAVLTGYLGWEYTLDGLRCQPGSNAAWLIEKRNSKPDFGLVINNAKD